MRILLRGVRAESARIICIQSSIGGIIYIYILGGFSERKATPERLEEIVKKVVKPVHRLEKENLDY